MGGDGGFFSFWNARRREAALNKFACSAPIPKSRDQLGLNCSSQVVPSFCSLGMNHGPLRIQAEGANESLSPLHNSALGVSTCSVFCFCFQGMLSSLSYLFRHVRHLVFWTFLSFNPGRSPYLYCTSTSLIQVPNQYINTLTTSKTSIIPQHLPPYQALRRGSLPPPRAPCIHCLLGTNRPGAFVEDNRSGC